MRAPCAVACARRLRLGTCACGQAGQEGHSHATWCGCLLAASRSDGAWSAPKQIASSRCGSTADRWWQQTGPETACSCSFAKKAERNARRDRSLNPYHGGMVGARCAGLRAAGSRVRPAAGGEHSWTGNGGLAEHHRNPGGDEPSAAKFRSREDAVRAGCRGRQSQGWRLTPVAIRRSSTHDLRPACGWPPNSFAPALAVGANDKATAAWVDAPESSNTESIETANYEPG